MYLYVERRSCVIQWVKTIVLFSVIKKIQQVSNQKMGGRKYFGNTNIENLLE